MPFFFHQSGVDVELLEEDRHAASTVRVFARANASSCATDRGHLHAPARQSARADAERAL
jgi:hypothetical protein